MSIYTSVQTYKGKTYYRGYDDNDKREQYIVGFPGDPCKEHIINSIYFRKCDNKLTEDGRSPFKEIRDNIESFYYSTDYKNKITTKVNWRKCDDITTMFGESCFALDFNYRDEQRIKQLIPSYIKIFNDIEFKYKYIRQKNAKNTLQKQPVIAYIDIETETESGFSTVEDTTERINCISLRIQDGKMYVWALGKAQIDKPDIELRCFTSEKEMMKDFMLTWRKLDFDVISGWNIDHFDLPYIYNRVLKILDEEWAKMLSPFNEVQVKMDKNPFTYAYTDISCVIIGIQVLDYLAVWKKHTYENLENYKLNTVANFALGEGKLGYEEQGNLRNLYNNDFQKFVEYNIKDTDLVYRIELAMRLISLIFYISYMAGCNYEDIESGTKTWDVIIFNYFLDNNMVIPPKEVHEKTEKFPGAYVRTPIPGHYDWIISFDATSLYPSLIMQQNISAETIQDETYKDFQKYSTDPKDEYKLDGIIQGKADLSWLKEKNLCLSPSGHLYSKEKEGFAPILMKKYFNGRKTAKKEMLTLEQVSQDMMIELEKRGLTPSYEYKKPHH